MSMYKDNCHRDVAICKDYRFYKRIVKFNGFLFFYI